MDCGGGIGVRGYREGGIRDDDKVTALRVVVVLVVN